jgi:hypothetical protein
LIYWFADITIYVIRCNNSNSRATRETSPASRIIPPKSSRYLTVAEGIMVMFLSERARSNGRMRRKSKNLGGKSKKGLKFPSVIRFTPFLE